MKNVKNISLSLLALSSLLLVSACGGGGGGGGEAQPSSGASDSPAPAAAVASISGKVADGYLREARVFLDRNNNGAYDNGEPTAMSGPGGVYTLEVSEAEAEQSPVVVEVISGQTIDEDDGRTVTHDYQLEAPAGKWQFVSPLTTLVKAELEKNPSFTELEAVLKVRSELGIDDEVSLFEDYLAQQDNQQKAASGSRLTEEYRRAHQVARVVADLLGNLRADLVQNLGGPVAPNERQVVSFMVTDKILQQGKAIRQALRDERNGAANIDLDALKGSMRARIKPNLLNHDALQRYKQRREQKPQVWDMDPPGLVKKTPVENGPSSVDVTIGMIFDEPLDETTLAEGVEVRGPNGLLRGEVRYDAETRQLSFLPDQLLLPYSEYQVTLTRELKDISGNPLEEELTWEFSTIFDKTPPAMPDF